MRKRSFNATFTIGRRQHQIHAPILILLIWIVVLILLVPTIPIHLVFWLFGRRGFWNGQTRNYTYQNPFPKPYRLSL